MALPDNEGANALAFMEKISSLTEKIGTVSLQGIDEVSMFLSGRENDLISLLESMTEDIDKPIFKSLANDLIGVLGSFYISEDMLCCLIKNLLITLQLEDKLLAYNDFVKSLQSSVTSPEYAGLHINEDNFQYILSETKFARILDTFIVIIDIILVFLELDLSDLIFPSLDFIKEISEAVIGFLCIAMQELLFTLRDSGINYIITAISENTSKSNWAKCMPYIDFIEILKKYIHDYGLTAKLAAMIQGHIGNWFNKFKKKLDLDLAKHVKLIEFLKYLKLILSKIKEAVLSWEYCAFLNDDTTVNNTDDTDTGNPYLDYLKSIISDSRGSADNYNSNDFIFADNNTILNNDKDLSTGDNGQNSVKLANNDEIRNFLMSYMGLSADKTDQLLGDTGLNTDTGNVGNSCGYVINPNDTAAIFKLLIEQSRVG